MFFCFNANKPFYHLCHGLKIIIIIVISETKIAAVGRWEMKQFTGMA